MSDKLLTRPAANWYAVQTKPKAELGLLQLIKANKSDGKWQIDAYLPMKQTANAQIPLFSGYVFVKHDDSGFHQLQYTTGVKRYVRFGGYPTPIPEKDISLIQLVESHFGQAEFKESYLMAGQPVRIMAGVLNGRTGKLLENACGKRVALEIENLGYSLAVSVPPNHIFPLPTTGNR